MPVFFVHINKPEFSRHILVKCTILKYHENLPSRSRFVFTRTDGHDESLTRAFRNFANALRTEVAVANMDKNRRKTQLPIQTETQTAIKNI